MLEKITHGNVRKGGWGNLRLTVELGQDYGDAYSDAFYGHGLRCAGWADLGYEVVKASIGNPVNKCFFGEVKLIMKNNATEKEVNEGNDVRHAYFSLSGPSSSKILDSWPSGGWEY